MARRKAVGIGHIGVNDASVGIDDRDRGSRNGRHGCVFDGSVDAACAVVCANVRLILNERKNAAWPAQRSTFGTTIPKHFHDFGSPERGVRP